MSLCLECLSPHELMYSSCVLILLLSRKLLLLLNQTVILVFHSAVYLLMLWGFFQYFWGDLCPQQRRARPPGNKRSLCRGLPNRGRCLLSLSPRAEKEGPFAPWRAELRFQSRCSSLTLTVLINGLIVPNCPTVWCIWNHLTGFIAFNDFPLVLEAEILVGTWII